MNGLLIVDKPVGLTSADVVRTAKRLLRTKTGHLGTLDPFASGVLPLCVGDGTKIAQFLNESDKSYQGLIRLGAETDTGDPTGTIVASADVPALNEDVVDQVAARFIGESEQVPPMYSAIKRAGTPLYKLARQGIEVDRLPRRIRIDHFRLRLQDATTLAFEVACSKGTYVRVLANDVAAALGTLGHLTTLRRIRFGHFNEEDAVSFERLERGDIELIGLTEALRDLRECALGPAEAQRARSGFVPLLNTLPHGHSDEAMRLLDPAGALIAVVVCDENGSWRYARVFS